jgi:hypothetical protein
LPSNQRVWSTAIGTLSVAVPAACPPPTAPAASALVANPGPRRTLTSWEEWHTRPGHARGGIDLSSSSHHQGEFARMPANIGPGMRGVQSIPQQGWLRSDEGLVGRGQWWGRRIAGCGCAWVGCGGLERARLSRESLRPAASPGPIAQTTRRVRNVRPSASVTSKRASPVLSPHGLPPSGESPPRSRTRTLCTWPRVSSGLRLYLSTSERQKSRNSELQPRGRVDSYGNSQNA